MCVHLLYKNHIYVIHTYIHTIYLHIKNIYSSIKLGHLMCCRFDYNGIQGAKAVQVGTCHWTEGPACFDRIATELQGIMTKKGYNSLEDFRGKLKPYVKSGAAAKGSSSSSSSKETKQSVLSPLPVAGSVGYLVGVVLYSILVAIFAIVAARYTGIVGV